MKRYKKPFERMTNGKLYNEKLSLTQEIGALVSSLENSSNQEWMFGNEKHLKDFYTTDDELLHTLDNFSNILLASTEDDNLSKEMDSLSAQYVFD
jgi:hypothetical protein